MRVNKFEEEMAGSQLSDRDSGRMWYRLRKEVDQLFTFSWVTWGADNDVASVVGISSVSCRIMKKSAAGNVCITPEPDPACPVLR